MLLVLRALLVLSLAPLLHGARKSQSVSAKLGPRAGLKGHSVRLVIDPSVLPHFTAKSPSSIANMSLSPWTYIDSSVDSRLPKHISNAQCLTTGCLSPQGGGEDRALEAKPIKYEVLVLHRVLKPSKKKGRKTRKQYIFTLGTEVITAGCTCVRPTVIPQG
ncbi:interleukin-17F-like [Pelmatolapia mariae]|uniref:interleukin-17F-like n=1 Tax=Pelmatolapia mariae TaxID=158779 RepID=UPI002FE572B0